MKIAFHTLGCKVNAYDTNEIKHVCSLYGFSEALSGEAADAVVINTCCVTNESERKSRQLIHRAKTLNPAAVILVCGCYARTKAETVKQNSPADIVTDSKDPFEITAMLAKALNTVSEPKNKNAERFVTSFSRTRAEIKIQDGCTMFCSYCIIPYARGNPLSRDPDEIIKQINLICENGCAETVLTGIHLASYKHGDTRLIDLIERISSETAVQRLRLGSLEPRLLSEAFLSRLKQCAPFCPHFHISMQSGSDGVLKRMNRKYTSSEYLNICERVKSFFPEAMLTTDVITGFPGETEAEFAETVVVCEKAGFSHIHVFPYSPKKGTPAAEMPEQHTNAVKRARCRALIEKGEEITKKVLTAQIGKTLSVLFEKASEKNIYEGYSENYLKVYTSSEKDLSGKVLSVKTTALYADGLFGLAILD